MSRPQLGPKLAEGRTAEIYHWQPGWVLKLFFDWMPEDEAEHEARVTRAAHASGFRAPAVGDLVDTGERAGLVMEHIQGSDLLAALLAQPWRADAFARQLAELHLAMHQCQPKGMPELHDKLRRRLQSAPGLSANQRTTLLARLESLPQGTALCHGDLHPQNVILADDGPVVIDWVDGSIGNPLADVARATVLLTLGGQPEGLFAKLFVALFRRRSNAVYLRRYFANQPQARAEYRQWLPIVDAARLNEGITEDNPRLLAAVARWLDA